MAAPEGDLLPGLTQAWTQKGKALQQLDKTEEARTAYQQALRIDPEFASATEALDNLGRDT